MVAFPGSHEIVTCLYLKLSPVAGIHKATIGTSLNLKEYLIL